MGRSFATWRVLSETQWSSLARAKWPRGAPRPASAASAGLDRKPACQKPEWMLIEQYRRPAPANEAWADPRKVAQINSGSVQDQGLRYARGCEANRQSRLCRAPFDVLFPKDRFVLPPLWVVRHFAQRRANARAF